MAPNFSKNAILSGIVDYYCLVCENHLKSEDDVINHIEKSTHKTQLDQTSFEIEDDCIRKIKKWYFCEFCNYIIKTKPKVRLHSNEKEHIRNKICQSLKRCDNSIVAFGEMTISNRAWNGLCEGTCLVCSCEYPDEQDHLNDSSHIVNMLCNFENNIEIDEQKNLYRLIDETCFQCMICNMIESVSFLRLHFVEENHKKLFEKCRQSTIKPVDTKTCETKNKEINEFIKNDENKTDTIKSKDNVNNNKDKADASPKIKKNAPTKNISQQQQINNIQMNETLICKVLRTDNYVMDAIEGRKWCILCNCLIDSFNVENHINGGHHKNILKLHKTRIEKLSAVAHTTVDGKKTDEKTIAECKMPDKFNKNEQNVKFDSDSKVKAVDCSKILDSVEKLQKKGVNINFERNKAICTKCSKSIDFNFESIEKHINEHKTDNIQKVAESSIKSETYAIDFTLQQEPTKNTTLFSSPVMLNKNKTGNPSQQGDNLESYAKANMLIYKKGENHVYCKLCRAKIPFVFYSMKEHVNGYKHKRRGDSAIKINNTKAGETVFAECFVKDMIIIDQKGWLSVIINKELCVNMNSFRFLMNCETADMFRCAICMELVYNDEDVSTEHIRNHDSVADKGSVVTGFTSEFIRVIRPNCYHCGFCNELFNSWEELEGHLLSTKHKENKKYAKWCLDTFLQEITTDNVEFCLVENLYKLQI